MPVKSAKQFRMMEAIANKGGNSKFGPSKKVADEMLKKTSHSMKSKFAKDKK
jgi:hypothetical protein